jgi:MYXO-CTERM domain-containing protein
MPPVPGSATLAVAAGFATIAGWCAAARAEVLWSGDPSRAKNEVFKSTGSTGTCGEPNSLALADDPQRGTVWRYHKPAESGRCENHGIKVDGKSFVFENNKTYYLGWWSKLTSTADNNANFQWKSYGDGHEQNFPLVIRVRGGEMTLMQRQPDNVETILWRRKATANQWNHFVLGLKLSNQTRGGWVELYFNGVLQNLTTGGTRYACRLFDSGNHQCPKWGVYGGRGREMSNYADDMKVGTTLGDVAMAGARPNPNPNPNPNPQPDPTPPGPGPGPDPGELTFEAEDIEVVNSGTGTSVQADPRTSGGRWVALDAENAGSWMEFTLEGVPAGIYHLKLGYKTNSNRGQLVVRVDGDTPEAQLGGGIDQYAADSTYDTAVVGPVTFSRAGDHKVRLVVTGKSDQSAGFVLSADRFILSGTMLSPLDPDDAEHNPGPGASSPASTFTTQGFGCRTGGPDSPGWGVAPVAVAVAVLMARKRRRKT